MVDTMIQVWDEPDHSGVNHHYKVVEAEKAAVCFADVRFRNGGESGVSTEDLLRICAHRLSAFADVSTKCQDAEDKVRSALDDLFECSCAV